MARTTEAAVREIIKTKASLSITPFIDTANDLVTRVCGFSGTPYSSTTLELIERWLAAHFYAIRDMRNASESTGKASQSKQFKIDLGLANTMWGQQAMMIDTEGYLAAINDATATDRRTRVGMSWGGSSVSDQSQARRDVEGGDLL